MTLPSSQQFPEETPPENAHHTANLSTGVKGTGFPSAVNSRCNLVQTLPGRECCRQTALPPGPGGTLVCSAQHAS